MKDLFDRLKISFFQSIAFLLYLIYAGYSSTLKIVRLDHEFFPRHLVLDQNTIYAFWHSKTFALVPFFKDARMGILTLRDWRNVIYDRICRQFGYSTLPITNSGRAALELKKLLEQGRAIGLAVDGPHGPAGTVKPGVFFLAKTTGRPIVAMHVRALKSFRLKSRWDRYEIPWPFSEVVISPARPLWVTVENEKESERMIRIHLGDL